MSINLKEELVMYHSIQEINARGWNTKGEKALEGLVKKVTEKVIEGKEYASGCVYDTITGKSFFKKVTIIRLGDIMYLTRVTRVGKEEGEDVLAIFLEEGKVAGINLTVDYAFHGGKDWTVVREAASAESILRTAWLWPFSYVTHPYFVHYEASDDSIKGELSDGTWMEAEADVDIHYELDLRDKSGTLVAEMVWDADDGLTKCWGFPDYFWDYLKMIPDTRTFAELAKGEH